MSDNIFFQQILFLGSFELRYKLRKNVTLGVEVDGQL